MMIPKESAIRLDDRFPFPAASRDDYGGNSFEDDAIVTDVGQEIDACDSPLSVSPGSSDSEDDLEMRPVIPECSLAVENDVDFLDFEHWLHGGLGTVHKKEIGTERFKCGRRSHDAHLRLRQDADMSDFWMCQKCFPDEAAS